MRQEIQSVILCGALTRLEQLPAPPSAKVLCQLAGLELPILAELRGAALAVADEAAIHARHALHLLAARKEALLELAAQIDLRSRPPRRTLPAPAATDDSGNLRIVSQLHIIEFAAGTERDE